MTNSRSYDPKDADMYLKIMWFVGDDPTQPPMSTEVVECKSVTAMVSDTLFIDHGLDTERVLEPDFSKGESITAYVMSDTGKTIDKLYVG